MIRTIISTHYEATDASGEKAYGEVITAMTERQLKKYIEKVHGIKADKLSFFITSDRYEISDDDFIKYATKVEKKIIFLFV